MQETPTTVFYLQNLTPFHNSRIILTLKSSLHSMNSTRKFSHFMWINWEHWQRKSTKRMQRIAEFFSKINTWEVNYSQRKLHWKHSSTQQESRLMKLISLELTTNSMLFTLIQQVWRKSSHSCNLIQQSLILSLNKTFWYVLIIYLSVSLRRA